MVAINTFIASLPAWVKQSLSLFFVVGWYSLIYWFSDQPNLPGFDQSWLNFLWFKSAHLLVYATLGTLVFICWRQFLPDLKWKQTFVLTLLVVLILATHDEWHQSFVPGRTPALRDVLIDLLGASVFLGIVKRYNHLYPKFGM